MSFVWNLKKLPIWFAVSCTLILDRRKRYVAKADGAPNVVISLDDENQDAADAAAKVKGVKLTYPTLDKATKTYSNPWKEWDPKFRTNVDLVKWWVLERDPFGVPGSKVLAETLPIIEPDMVKLNSPPPQAVQMMWIGHATVLVQMDGLTILTDPVFSTLVGPTRVIGAKRYRKPPCRESELPKIDAVLISHDHYDHLDYQSVVNLNKQFPDIWWFVPEGSKDWFTDTGVKNVVELSWWRQCTLTLKNGATFTFVCTPVQHWCRRGVWKNDANKSLWCSWLVKGPNHSFYFTGDTGYCEAFKQIGEMYGPITLAAIPIGGYEPRFHMQAKHVNPEEAVQIHRDLQAQHSLGIHWGTFKLTSEHYLEPKEKIEKLNAENFFLLKHGEVHTVAGEKADDNR